MVIVVLRARLLKPKQKLDVKHKYFLGHSVSDYAIVNVRVSVLLHVNKLY